MTPSILIVGATGNTGRNVVRTLPNLLKATIGSHRILALTRDVKSSASQELAKIPHVELIEKDWTEIDAAWLKAPGVVRAFVAGHILPSQFMDESALYLAMLQAAVEYVVKISTMEEFVGPANTIYYGRTHWAIEQMLSHQDFESLQWTSLRPNVFTSVYLAPAIQWVKDFKRTEVQQPLKILLGADDKMALIDPDDIGHIAATLLATENPSPHNKAKYILRGAEDITGQGVVDLVEQHTGVKVQDVWFRDTSMITDMVKYGYPEKVISSILSACEPVWAGKCTTSFRPTSKPIMEIAPPTTRIADAFKALVEG